MAQTRLLFEAPRRAVVFDLAPAKPPCFRTQRGWLEYLSTAAEAQKHGSTVVLILRDGKHEISKGFNFCTDCRPEYQAAEAAAGRCQPDFLRLTSRATTPD